MFTRTWWSALAIGLLGAVVVQTSWAEPDPNRTRSRGGFNLFASSTLALDGNRVLCGLDNQGNTCTDLFGSPLGGGGFWPKGSPNQYIFNSGVQIAGIIAPDAGFEWANDTTGAFFMDASGGLAVGEQLTDIFSSLNANDLANWPNGAIVRDTNLYNAALLNKPSLSQQDSWVRYWDGNATLPGGRDHPMGVVVEQRSLAWNFPAGNEDIIYFIYTVTNVSASDASAYAGLDPAIQGEYAAFGQQFQENVASTLGVDIPSGGYTVDSVFLAYTADPDVGNAVINSSTAILPFQMGVAYKNDFDEPTWLFPADINSLPFGPYPGFFGAKFLSSPIDPLTGEQVGLALFSNTNNPSRVGNFEDPQSVPQLWRYLSGSVTSLEGDQLCTFPNPRVAKLCSLIQAPTDTRFFQSSGPFSLAAGQQATIVLAFVHGAPVEPVGTNNFGGNLAPGVPPSGAEIFADPTLLREIEIGAGWAGQNDDDGDGIIQQDEVVLVGSSLLAKAIVAQNLFDLKFLLPFAPTPPAFVLVPGDNQVTVVWTTSATEVDGDPYFDVASGLIDPTSPLVDENYRFSDVEGYRIYRGRTPADLQLVAQFDYSGTTLNDFRGAWDYGVKCAPELFAPFDAPPNCPVDFTAPANFVAHPIVGDMPQVRLPGRAELANGDVLLLAGKLDTTWPDRVAAALPGLTDTGVPFAFVDNGVQNSNSYVYTVTAFDVNSINSGPATLESSRITQLVTPRATSPNIVAASLVTSVTGDDGVPLDILARFPAIDADDGTFAGNMPAINSGLLDVSSLIPEVLPVGDATIRIDSVGLGWAGGFGPAPPIFFTLSAPGVPDEELTFTNVSIPQFNSGAVSGFNFPGPRIAYDPAAATLVGIAFDGDAPTTFSGIMTPMAYSSPAVGTASGRYGVSGYTVSRYLSHSRWLDVGGTEVADPTITSLADAANNSGSLTGVDRIWAPSSYRTNTATFSVNFRGQGASGMTAWYPADFVVTWNADGSVTVRDITHNVDLPPAGSGGSGQGFINISDIVALVPDQATFDGAVADGQGSPAFNVLSYQHLYTTQPTCSNTWWAIPTMCIDLNPIAELQSLDFDHDGTADGTGIAIWINGEIFFMEMAALPAAGTEWQLRAVSGVMGAVCTPALSSVMTDCNKYTFAANPGVGTVVPGLRFNVALAPSSIDETIAVDLANVHTVPDPYYVTSSLELTPTQKIIKFVNLPTRAIIRIYSVSGILVDIIEHNSPIEGSSEATWDVRNRNEQFVASGVYFYHIEDQLGQEKIGRFTVVNFAQ